MGMTVIMLMFVTTLRFLRRSVIVLQQFDRLLLMRVLVVIGMMRRGFPDIQWTLEETIAEGDRIAARFTMRGTHQGTFLGVAPTGRKIEVKAMNFHRLSEGKFVEEHGQPDLLGLLLQIGSMPG